MESTHLRIATLTLLLAGCGAESSRPGETATETVAEFSTISCPSVTGASSAEAGTALINESHRFVELFLASDLNSQQVAPDINFDEQSVIAIHLGAKPTSGYEVQVVEVNESASAVIVDYEVTSPSRGCEVDTAITFPFCFVAIHKTEKEVEFNAIQRTSCPNDGVTL